MVKVTFSLEIVEKISSFRGWGNEGIGFTANETISVSAYLELRLMSGFLVC
jgi:hypothetical protein